MQNYLIETQGWIKQQLDSTVDFWLKNGKDEKHGGIYTCLDEKGKVYSTDKSVWMQGRTGWTFSRLCNQYGERPAWRDMAKSCLDFLEKYCINHNAGRRMYFTVTEDGRPLRQRRYCFSEAFYAMANAEYYILTKEPERLERAKQAYNIIWNLNNGLIEDPTGMGPKTIPETRRMRALADPMIYINLSYVMRNADKENSEYYTERINKCIDDILKYHYKEDMKCTLESVGMNGEFFNEITAGRILNPGHVIECSWFLMDEANLSGNKELHSKARVLLNDAFNIGWDEEYGGLLYFVDCLGNPPEAYEHDMKLWWPHTEALIALIMAYRDTGEEKYLDMFKKTIDYSREYFADDVNGEWYGYLRRDGKPTEPPCKGSTFKGPFHVQRALMYVDSILGNIINK